MLGASADPVPVLKGGAFLNKNEAVHHYKGVIMCWD